MGELALNARQLEVVKRTVAKDTNTDEFNLFVEIARQTGLDPFRRQIIPVIFSKNNAAKRSMTIIYSRDGLRCIASRNKNYRPKSKPAKYVYDEKLMSKTNPIGIVSVSVELYWLDPSGKWFPISGEAYWDEYAPVEKEWNWGDQKGQKVYTGEETLSSMWLKMPRNMIEKCAESQALRAGWPEQFSNLYGEEEMAKAIADDLDASELVEQGRIERLEKSLQFANSIGFNFSGNIVYLKSGEIYDHWMNLIHEHKDNPNIILTMKDQNRQPLIHFWQMSPNDALGLKAEFEKLEAQASKELA